MKDGQCPKCRSYEVFASRGGGGVGEGCTLQMLAGDTMEPTKSWITYLCLCCGYYENYLTDEKSLAKIRDNPEKMNWQRVKEAESV